MSEKHTPVEAVELILNEYYRAANQHPSFTTAHHGKAVIEEELDELWDHIKADNLEDSLREAIQVGAMALRYLVDLSGKADDVLTPKI